MTIPSSSSSYFSSIFIIISFNNLFFFILLSFFFSTSIFLTLLFFLYLIFPPSKLFFYLFFPLFHFLFFSASLDFLILQIYLRASVLISLLPHFYSDGQYAQNLHKQNTSSLPLLFFYLFLLLFSICYLLSFSLSLSLSSFFFSILLLPIFSYFSSFSALFLATSFFSDLLLLATSIYVSTNLTSHYFPLFASCHMQVHPSGNYIPMVISSPNHTSLSSMVATFLAIHLMTVLQPSGYSIFHGGDIPIQLSLP